MKLTGLALLVLAAIWPGAAEAAIYNVTTTADSAPEVGACAGGDTDCTLREAVLAANASTGVADTINVPAGTYTLAIAGSGEAENGDLELGLGDGVGTESGPLTIRGAGARTTAVSGGGIDRVFDVQGEEVVVISGITVTGGNTDDDGGGIQIDDGDGDGALTLDRVAVVGNRTTDEEDGGGIDNDGVLTITNSAITGNIADGQGGGIEHDDTTSLTNVTLSGNRSEDPDPGDDDGGGGAIDSDGDELEPGQTQGIATINHTTIVGNSATLTGGAIQHRDVTFPTEALVRIRNSIVGGNTATQGGGNCSGTLDIQSLGSNIESGNTCGFNASGDQRSTNPLVGPLANNGGSTNTRALLAGSPAIDRAAAAACPATDQRGVARPIGAACDVGAFEASVTSPGPSPPPVDPEAGCVNAAVRIGGRRIGPARLGRTKRRQRGLLKGFSLRSRPGLDRYCAKGGGSFRIGYPTRRLLRRTPRRVRRRVRGRVVIILVSSRRPSLKGIRVGNSVRRVRRRLRRERRIRVGRNVWFLTRGKSATQIVQTRGGRVRAIGIGDKRLVRSQAARKRFLRAWEL